MKQILLFSAWILAPISPLLAQDQSAKSGADGKWMLKLGLLTDTALGTSSKSL